MIIDLCDSQEENFGTHQTTQPGFQPLGDNNAINRNDDGGDDDDDDDDDYPPSSSRVTSVGRKRKVEQNRVLNLYDDDDDDYFDLSGSKENAHANNPINSGSSSSGLPRARVTTHATSDLVQSLSLQGREAFNSIVSLFPEHAKEMLFAVVADCSRKSEAMEQIVAASAEMIFSGLQLSQPPAVLPTSSSAPSYLPSSSSSSSSSSSASTAVLRKKTPLEEVLTVFPSASTDYVTKLLVGLPIDKIITMMAEKGYERQSSSSSDEEKDFSSLAWETSTLYRHNAITQLLRDFPQFKKEGLLRLFAGEKNKNHYTPTLRLIESTLAISAHTHPDPVMPFFAADVNRMEIDLNVLGLKVRKIVNKKHASIQEWDPVFSNEFAAEEKRRRDVRQETDRRLAAELNDKLAEATGATIECGCCYGEYAFENLIQCCEGHLFCRPCLSSWVSQTVFGDGKSSVRCMNTTEACTGFFPDSMLRRALPDKIFNKLQEAMASDAIKSAQLEMVSCHHCALSVEMGEDAGFVLSCVRCLKETCKLCGDESHVPLKCSEVEKKGSMDIRVQVEEAMTKARVRECHKCKARFYKVEGCNKMACTCGAFICYCCRKDISKDKYAHFCQTPHCQHTSCGRCVLFTDSMTDDRKAMYDAGLATTKAAGQDAVAAVNMGALLEGGMPVAKKSKFGGREELMWGGAAGAPPRPNGAAAMPQRRGRMPRPIARRQVYAVLPPALPE